MKSMYPRKQQEKERTQRVLFQLKRFYCTGIFLPIVAKRQFLLCWNSCKKRIENQTIFCSVWISKTKNLEKKRFCKKTVPGIFSKSCFLKFFFYSPENRVCEHWGSDRVEWNRVSFDVFPPCSKSVAWPVSKHILVLGKSFPKLIENRFKWNATVRNFL